jgi:hypothetical protein
MWKKLLGIGPATALLLLLMHQALIAKVDVYPGKTPVSDYKTFRWARARVFTVKQGFMEDDPIVIPAIKKAVSAQLVKAGMTELTENADIDLYSMAMGASVPNVDFMIFGIYPTTNSMAAGSQGFTTIPMGRYNKEGTLALHLVDAKTNKSVWLAIVTRAIKHPDKLEPEVNKAVDEMFKKFKR